MIFFSTTVMLVKLKIEENILFTIEQNIWPYLCNSDAGATKNQRDQTNQESTAYYLEQKATNLFF